MQDRPTVNRLAALAYAALAERSRWQEFLRRLLEAFPPRTPRAEQAHDKLRGARTLATGTEALAELASGLETTDALTLAELLPHLRQAREVETRIHRLESEKRAVRSALDHVPVGVVLCDTSGRVELANAAAREVLDRRDGLIVASEALAAQRPSDTEALLRLIRESGGTLRVSRRGDGEPLAVLVAPLEGVQARVAVFVEDPTHRVPGPFEALQSLYDLTPAEARLASLLMEDRATLESAAARMRVEVSTVRTHLKRVFDKTGTHSQTALVRRLVGGVARVRLRS